MIGDTIWLLAELVALFFGVAFAIHLLQRRIGADRLRAWMGGTPVVSALKGIAVGFITPFCTYSAIPMLVGLRQAGVPPAGYVAFVSAAPVLDPVLFGALIVIVGVQAALIYVAVAFTAGLEDLADEPGQQTTLAGQVRTLGAGLANQSLSKVLQRCSLREHLSRQHHRLNLVVHDVDPFQPTTGSGGPSDHAVTQTS